MLHRFVDILALKSLLIFVVLQHQDQSNKVGVYIRPRVRDLAFILQDFVRLENRPQEELSDGHVLRKCTVAYFHSNPEQHESHANV